MTERNSTVRGRELGVRLRHYRTKAGLSERGAGLKLGVSVSTICRIERGYRNPELEEVASLLAYYDVRGPERDELLDMAREVAQRGWWFKTDPKTKRRINVLASQEARATEIVTYESGRIPGLLQIEPYIAALHRDSGLIREEEIPARVAARVQRRHVLFKNTPVDLRALIDETALHRMVGSAAVLHKQLDYLIHLTTRQNIFIRVIPPALSPQCAAFDPFHLMRFAEAPTVVLTEGSAGGQYYEEPQEIEIYERVAHKLSTLALSTEESVELMTRLMRALEEHPDVLPQVGWPDLAEE